MELDSLHVDLAVPQPHHRAVVGLGRHLEHVGQRRTIDDERVVSRGFERVWQAFEHTGAVVADQRCLAVHHLARPDDLAAERLPDALMTEANAEHRPAPGDVRDDLVGETGIVRSSRTRAAWIITRPRTAVAHFRTSIVFRPDTTSAAHGCLRDRA